jgi:hypothetical protein
MGIVNTKVLLKNPRKPELEPVEVEAFRTPHPNLSPPGRGLR